MKKALLFACLIALIACNTTKPKQQFTTPIQSLNISKAQLLTVQKRTVLVVANTQAPDKVACYYVLQGAPAKEQSIPQASLNESNDFVSLQAGSNFWILTLSESDRYRKFLTTGAKAKILKGFGLAKAQESGLDYDTFIAGLKSGKYDSRFK